MRLYPKGMLISNDYVEYVLDIPDCRSEHIFGASNFQYQNYIEQFDGSFFSFVAGMGGILSILLGIDVIMCIEFLFSVRNWFYAFVGWLKSQKSVENDTTSNGKPKRIRVHQSKNVIHVQPVTEL